MVQVATEPVTKTIEGCVLAATLAEGGMTRATKVITCDLHHAHVDNAHDHGGAGNAQDIHACKDTSQVLSCCGGFLTLRSLATSHTA